MQSFYIIDTRKNIEKKPLKIDNFIILKLKVQNVAIQMSNGKTKKCHIVKMSCDKTNRQNTEDDVFFR